MTNKIPVRDQRGQTVTEFALVLPLLMLVLLAILQFGVLFRDYLAVTDAGSPTYPRRYCRSA